MFKAITTNIPNKTNIQKEFIISFSSSSPVRKAAIIKPKMIKAITGENTFVRFCKVFFVSNVACSSAVKFL